MRRHRPGPLALLALLGAVSPALAQEVGGEATRAPPARLTLDLPATVTVTGGLLLLAGLGSAAQDALTPPACRWCEPGPVDRWARDALRWSDPGRAAQASDVLQVAVPAGAALTLALLARHAGAGGREVVEDLLVLTEAVALAAALTVAAKPAVARLRPAPWAAEAPPGVNDLHSFWSGHTSSAFAAAAAATQVARLRGRAGWRWLAAASFAGAAAVGWLRVAGDQHWLTDVLAGAAVGTACGLGVPAMVLRPARDLAPALTLAPAPGGLALRF